jgi:multisubunit Na+/H+ antiporter MnhB subunit
MENLNLINWPMVAFAALWIIGLAVILSALGFAYYEAGQADEKLRARLRRPIYQRAVNIGLTLFCLGMIGSADALWERVLWGLFAAVFAFYTWQAGRIGDRDREKGGRE